MGLLIRDDHSLRCCLRKRWVSNTPEERIRQGVLLAMMHQLGVPTRSIAVELSLRKLPHLQDRRDLPERRIDILCFAPDMRPLLLIECKRGIIDRDAIGQVLGYNAFVQAPHIALADHRGVFSLNGDEIREGLPSYENLQLL